jgi:hypothetical protein
VLDLDALLLEVPLGLGNEDARFGDRAGARHAHLL